MTREPSKAPDVGQTAEDNERFDRVVEELAHDIAADSRQDEDAAARVVRSELEGDAGFRQAVRDAPTMKRLRKIRAGKEAITRARRRVYYELRRYRQDEAAIADAVGDLEAAVLGTDPSAVATACDAVARAHVSTAERLGHVGQLHDALAPALTGARSLLDIGAGTFPLVFDFGRFTTIRHYVAADRDALAMRAVRAYGRWLGNDRLTAHDWDIVDGWSSLLSDRAIDTAFDVALMLKLIPVVKRRAPQALAILGAVPAERVVVTGSRQAMVKRRAIEGRERRDLEHFADDHGWIVRDHFETEDEVGLILERGG
jgi:16S rRNA (guanine(1405)-N(7))-methyltransferase